MEPRTQRTGCRDQRWCWGIWSPESVIDMGEQAGPVLSYYPAVAGSQ